MKRVCVLGHFAFGISTANGQTIKTKILTNELVRQLGENEVRVIDTHGGFKTLLKAPFQTFSALKNSRNVIILPAHNGLRIYGRILPILKCLFKKRRIHYVVIGGWLAEFLKDKKGLAKALKKFDGIYVETSTMKLALEEQGFTNIVVLPNFKELAILKEEELIYPEEEPYRLCTFSRVIKEKGIEDAVNAVRSVNEHFGKTVYTLNIYGQIDANQTEWFDGLQANFPEYVKYCGLVPFDQSVEVLKNHFALLFPTHYYTEGIPGTLIDAYAAGIPVITAKWLNCSDIFEDGVTGFGYTFDDAVAFNSLLTEIAETPSAVLSLKKNCLEKAHSLDPQIASISLIEKII